MILPLFLILLSFLGTGSALEVRQARMHNPIGAVILVVDGMGASYVYPEYAPYSMDGSALDKALLFNLTGVAAKSWTCEFQCLRL